MSYRVGGKKNGATLLGDAGSTVVVDDADPSGDVGVLVGVCNGMVEKLNLFFLEFLFILMHLLFFLR